MFDLGFFFDGFVELDLELFLDRLCRTHGVRCAGNRLRHSGFEPVDLREQFSALGFPFLGGFLEFFVGRFLHSDERDRINSLGLLLVRRTGALRRCCRFGVGQCGFKLVNLGIHTASFRSPPF